MDKFKQRLTAVALSGSLLMGMGTTLLADEIHEKFYSDNADTELALDIDADQILIEEGLGEYAEDPSRGTAPTDNGTPVAEPIEENGDLGSVVEGGDHLTTIQHSMPKFESDVFEASKYEAMEDLPESLLILIYENAEETGDLALDLNFKVEAQQTLDSEDGEAQTVTSAIEATMSGRFLEDGSLALSMPVTASSDDETLEMWMEIYSVNNEDGTYTLYMKMTDGTSFDENGDALYEINKLTVSKDDYQDTFGVNLNVAETFQTWKEFTTWKLARREDGIVEAYGIIDLLDMYKALGEDLSEELIAEYTGKVLPICYSFREDTGELVSLALDDDVMALLGEGLSAFTQSGVEITDFQLELTKLDTSKAEPVVVPQEILDNAVDVTLEDGGMEISSDGVIEDVDN